MRRFIVSALASSVFYAACGSLLQPDSRREHDSEVLAGASDAAEHRSEGGAERDRDPPLDAAVSEDHVDSAQPTIDAEAISAMPLQPADASTLDASEVGRQAAFDGSGSDGSASDGSISDSDALDSSGSDGSGSDGSTDSEITPTDWDAQTGRPESACWTLLERSGDQPTARSEAVFIYEPAQRRFLLVLGLSGAGKNPCESQACGGTPELLTAWYFQLEHGWSRAPSPSDGGLPRADLLVRGAYDEERGQVVVVDVPKEEPGQSKYPSATLAFDGQNWEKILTPPQEGLSTALYGLSYDSERQRLVMVGGSVRSSTGVVPIYNHWELGPQGWNESRAKESRATRRFNFPMAYHRSEKCTYLFGGMIGEARNDETWAFDGTRWIEEGLDAGHPSPRSKAAMVYDSSRQTLVLYGGEVAFDRYSDEIWEYEHDRWTLKAPAPGSAPPALSGASLAYNSDEHYALMFGGVQPTANGEDVGVDSAQLWMLRWLTPEQCSELALRDPLLDPPTSCRGGECADAGRDAAALQGER